MWAQVEAAVSGGNTEEARSAWGAFDRAMRTHFAMEEEVLFPSFEQASGMVAGPTQVMRIEHKQMRALLDQMAAEAKKDDFEALADHGDTLLMLIQQHNVKEENILYPMTEQHLTAQWAELGPRIEALHRSGND